MKEIVRKIKLKCQIKTQPIQQNFPIVYATKS